MNKAYKNTNFKEQQEKFVTAEMQQLHRFCSRLCNIRAPNWHSNNIFTHSRAKFDKSLQNNSDYSPHVGHTVCECKQNGKCILVDPTNNKIIKDYNQEKITIDYSIHGKDVFVPYFRNFDLGKKMKITEHNKMEEELCKILQI